MVKLAKSHKEVLESMEENKEEVVRDLKDEKWQKFDKFAKEYSEKAKVRRIPHLITSTELVIGKIQANDELDEDDLALLSMMQKCKEKNDKKKDKAHQYYVTKKDKSKDPSKKRARPQLIDKPEAELTEEEKLHNKKILDRKTKNVKRKIGDSESRARDKFFASVMQTYLPNVTEIVELCVSDDSESEKEG
jgi:hypothetical protein